MKAMNEVFKIRKRLLRKETSRLPENNKAVIRLIKIMFVYSAIKIKVKVPPLYSVLNPETSSDSPSAKSNGDRLVSAKVVANHVKNDGKIKRSNQEEKEHSIIFKSKVKSNSKLPNKIKDILIS